MTRRCNRRLGRARGAHKTRSRRAPGPGPILAQTTRNRLPDGADPRAVEPAKTLQLGRFRRLLPNRAYRVARSTEPKVTGSNPVGRVRQEPGSGGIGPSAISARPVNRWTEDDALNLLRRPL